MFIIKVSENAVVCSVGSTPDQGTARPSRTSSKWSLFCLGKSCLQFGKKGVKFIPV